MIFNVTKWDHRFLALARFVANFSKDPSTKVGAVVADEKRIISLGYNGFPPDIEDLPERLENREYKYKHIIHGEINAINFARESLLGKTLYTIPFMPCTVCAEEIIKRGITRVVAPFSDNPRWVISFNEATEKFKSASIELVLYENLIEVL